MPKRHPVTGQFISNAQYNKLITQQQRGENLTEGEASESNPPSPTNEEEGEEQVTSESDESSRHQCFETVSASSKRAAEKESHKGYSEDIETMSASTKRAAEDDMAGESSNNGVGQQGWQLLILQVVRNPRSTEIEKILKYKIDKVNKVNFSTWKHHLETHMDLQNCLEVVGYTKEERDDPEMIGQILIHPEWCKQN